MLLWDWLNQVLEALGLPAVTGALSLETARLAAFTDRFDALDTDGDGTLDLEEFALGFATAH